MLIFGDGSVFMVCFHQDPGPVIIQTRIRLFWRKILFSWMLVIVIGFLSIVCGYHVQLKANTVWWLVHLTGAELWHILEIDSTYCSCCVVVKIGINSIPFEFVIHSVWVTWLIMFCFLWLVAVIWSYRHFVLIICLCVDKKMKVFHLLLSEYCMFCYIFVAVVWTQVMWLLCVVSMCCVVSKVVWVNPKRTRWKVIWKSCCQMLLIVDQHGWKTGLKSRCHSRCTMCYTAMHLHTIV